jgi:hypothetical protein
VAPLAVGLRLSFRLAMVLLFSFLYKSDVLVA